MSLGTGVFSVGRGPEHFRPKAGRYPWQPHEWEPPLQATAYWHTHTEIDQWKNTHLTPRTYHKVGNTWRGGRGGDSSRRTSAKWSVKISMNPQKDSLKKKLNYSVGSARISKDSQQEQQLIDKGSYKPRLVMCNAQHNQAIYKHAIKEPHQRSGGAKFLRPPCIRTHALWGCLLTPQNTTRD